ncbi:dynamin family protein [Chitinivibrio alkaliphilus]|uniref:Dynamin N-terminal domain-containing protein n=1 Tax=Chitinivibrio alkaliphilus ACht1 TaxID=1313304 RepID=U7D457_9BACT|nr:dynamin family protein [Chitinivibrio alkaliphilus]ERP30743.1 hypothetical protein CALK_2434 [Chitinivibrio alkaliphilus ACht1]
MGHDAFKNMPKKEKTIPKNRYLENNDDGFNLLAQLISAESDVSAESEEILRDLENMVDKEFLELAMNNDCPRSAKIYSDLQKVYEDLVDVVNFPVLENTFTVAVGGGFSAGKSRFLNALLDEKNLLPTDTSPTTAIPTYILNGEENAVFALNQFQHRTEIDEEALHAISHAFNAAYNVTFSHILKRISVERTSIPYTNITFLDTPGYSKADDVIQRNNNTDEHIAKEHLRTADYLIWLVDIQNGTIPEPDINFILGLDYELEVLVVMNKADKKIESEVKKVVETARKDLKKNGIPTYDVIGFSSSKNIEYSESKTVLRDFLKK